MKGGCPLTMVNRITPAAHRSVFEQEYSCILEYCSGDIYYCVPMYSLEDSASVANPKSAIFKFPDESSSKFSGFKSR